MVAVLLLCLREEGRKGGDGRRGSRKERRVEEKQRGRRGDGRRESRKYIERRGEEKREIERERTRARREVMEGKETRGEERGGKDKERKGQKVQNSVVLEHTHTDILYINDKCRECMSVESGLMNNSLKFIDLSRTLSICMSGSSCAAT